MSEKYLNFQEISNNIQFSQVLDWLNISYTSSSSELKGETKQFKFIVSLDKNMFFSPNHEEIKGSVINFLSYVENIDLREAAKKLKLEFLTDIEKPIIDIPTLELSYHEHLKNQGIWEETAQKYEVGYVKQRSIMQGKIAFRVYDDEQNPVGYIGWKADDNKWFYPKNFKRPLYNLHNVETRDEVIVTVSPFECLNNIQIGKSNCVALLARSMSEAQEKLLRNFERILLLHPEPENIILRLSKFCYVLAPRKKISSLAPNNTTQPATEAVNT